MTTTRPQTRRLRRLPSGASAMDNGGVLPDWLQSVVHLESTDHGPAERLRT
jgi:hypothetical protein